jgi:glycosyltransferase involved in cell wall biosynthesis
MGVSVVIPTYNAGRFIEQAIESALLQDCPADEIIVVDDGSTDRDYSQLESLGTQIRVIRQCNRGVSAARNLGFDRAKQDYVAILDADDVWIQGKLRAQMTHLSQHPDCDAVFCLGLNWEPDGNGATWTHPGIEAVGAQRVPEAIRLHYRDFLCGIPVATSTMVVKKAVWQALGGYDESMRYGEDQEFNLRLSREYRVDVLDAIGMLYRRHPSSATGRIQERNHWAELIEGAVGRWGLEDRWGIHVDRAQIARHLGRLHFLHGYDHFWHGSLPVARREFGRALMRRPFAPRYLGYLLASSIPGVGIGLRAAFRPRPEPARSDVADYRPLQPDRCENAGGEPHRAEEGPNRERP